MKKVAVIMGSDSDLPIVEKGIAVLKEYGVPHEVHVYSAHRTPKESAEFAANAREAGFGVIIAAAGMAAPLARLDALLSTVQMPSGIPVATVAVGGAANAALLAVEMLALSDDALAAKLDAARAAGYRKVLEKDAAVAEKYNA